MPGSSYYRARYYDTTIGRFTSEDPIKYGGGINLYGYVLNNPSLLRDPTGLAPGCVPTTTGLVCDGDRSPLDLQKSMVQAIFPGSTPQGTSLILLVPCDDARKILDNSVHFSTGHFWDGKFHGFETWNPFLYWDPLFHSGGWEVRSTFGLHFRMKYGKNCDKTCTLDEFHIDEHNPMFNPLDHLFIDVPNAIGKGIGRMIGIK